MKKFRISANIELYTVIEVELDDPAMPIIEAANKIEQQLRREAKIQLEEAFKTMRPTITQIS